MTFKLLRALGSLVASAAVLSPVLALAQNEADPIVGVPRPGELGLQESVTPIMDSVTAFHNGVLLWTITIIVLVVLALLVIVMVRFNAKANPKPSTNTHNTLVEIVWTVAPILILVIIAIPSFGVLTDQLTIPDGQRKYLGSNIFSFGEVEVPAPELTVKATGQQWFWDYEYEQWGDLSMGKSLSSSMLDDATREQAKPNQPRLLAVDNELIVPVNTTVRVQVTADPSGVIHAFAVPAFGFIIDAVPGRLNETWFNARKTGLYYGQCRELCGKNHAFMPIAVRVVTREQFDTFARSFTEQGSYDDALVAANLAPIH